MNQVCLALNPIPLHCLSLHFPCLTKRRVERSQHNHQQNGPQKEHQASPKRNQAAEMAMPQVCLALPAAATVTVLLIGVEAWISQGQWKQHRSMSPGIQVSSLPDP